MSLGKSSRRRIFLMLSLKCWQGHSVRLRLVHTLPCHRAVYMPPSSNPLLSQATTTEPFSVPLMIMLGLSFKLNKASRSSFVRLLNLLEGISMSSNLSSKQLRYVSYDDVLVSWIKGRLISKSISCKRSLIIFKVPHKS